MFRKTKIFVIFYLVFTAIQARAQEIYPGKDGSIKNIETRAMVADNGLAYLATRTALYRTHDVAQGDKWQEVFSLPPGENEVNSLNARGRNILLGTKRGLFRSEDGGRTWQNVFRTVIREKSNILSIEISRYNPRRVAICTMKGLYLSEDFGSHWSDISANLRNKRISSVTLNKDAIYAAGEDGLYARRAGQTAWERIYVGGGSGAAGDAAGGGAEAGADSEAGDEAASAAEYEEALAAGELGAVSCVTARGSRVYAGVGKSVVYSDDAGASWKSVAGSGLGGAVNYILPSKNPATLYCATTKGVFEFTNEKSGWAELYKGMEKTLNASRILFCAEDEKALWAVTERGLYKLETGRYSADQYVDIERNLKSFKIAFDNEPSFRDLQDAAIKFCDVSPQKIQSWHRDSKLKALVPKVSVGLGNNQSSNTEIYTSATRDYAVVGPDDYSNNLDFSVSWDLGNLIWSDNQTSIDVRSRLNTQLRNDILDNLRRIYYERKRLQFDLVFTPPKDMRTRFERELRIQELTQAIDDLTGNYLSDHIKERSDKGEAKSGI